MNWMGGARSRVKAVSNKKKQREFFEKQKRSAFLAQSVKSPITIPALSQDLISFHLSQRNLQKKSHKPKPTTVIRQDLNNRASNDLALHVNLSKVNLDQTPTSKSKGLPNGWKLKKSSNCIGSEDADVDSSVGRENVNRSIIEEYKMPDSDISDIQKKLLQLSSIDDMFENHEKASTSHALPKIPNGRSNIISPYDNHISRHGLEGGIPQFPHETPDIHEAFKKYIYVDRVSQPQEDDSRRRKSDKEYIKLQKFLKHSMKKDMFHSKTRHDTGKKSKVLENMSSTLSRKECGMQSNNSKLSYSDLSKCTFASMPRKVNRNDELQDLESNQTYINPSEQKNYRHSMNELEEMIEEARQYNSKESITPSDYVTSPLYSTSSSSSSSGNSIPVFFQRKRKLINESEDRSFTSIKKIKRSVTDTKSFGGITEGVVNHQRKIKISDTTVLNSEYAEEMTKSNIVKTVIGSKLHVKDSEQFKAKEFNKAVFSKSFLSCFPTPGIRPTQNSKSESNSRVNNKFREAIPHRYDNISNFRMNEGHYLNCTPYIRKTITNSGKHRETSSKIFHESSTGISSSDSHIFPNFKSQNSPADKNFKSQNNESGNIHSRNLLNDSKSEEHTISNYSSSDQRIFKTPNQYDYCVLNNKTTSIDLPSSQQSCQKKLPYEPTSNDKVHKVDVATSPFPNLKFDESKLISNHLNNNKNSEEVTCEPITIHTNPIESHVVHLKNTLSDPKNNIDSSCVEIAKETDDLVYDANTNVPLLVIEVESVNSDGFNNDEPQFISTQNTHNIETQMKSTNLEVSSPGETFTPPSVSKIFLKTSPLCTIKQEIAENDLSPTDSHSPKYSEGSLNASKLNTDKERNLETNSLIENNSCYQDSTDHTEITIGNTTELIEDELPPTEPSSPQYNITSYFNTLHLRHLDKHRLDIDGFLEGELPPTEPSSPFTNSIYPLSLLKENGGLKHLDEKCLSTEPKSCHTIIDLLKNSSSNTKKILDDGLSTADYNSTRSNSTRNLRFSTPQENLNKDLSPGYYSPTSHLKASIFNIDNKKNLQNGSLPTKFIAIGSLKLHAENENYSKFELRDHKDVDEDPLNLTPVKINSLSCTPNKNTKHIEYLLQNCASKLLLHSQSFTNGYEDSPQNQLVNNLNKTTDVPLSPKFNPVGSPKTPISHENPNEDIPFSRLDTFHPKLDTTPFLLNITTYMKQLSHSKQIINDYSPTKQGIDSVVPEQNGYPDAMECSNLTCDRSCGELITETGSKSETLVINPSSVSFPKDDNEIPLNVEINETTPEVNDIPNCEGEPSMLLEENCMKLDGIFNSEEDGSTNKPGVLIKVQNFGNIPIENFPSDIFNGAKENGSDCLIKNTFDKGLQTVPEMADAWCQTSEICFRDFAMQTF